MQKVCPDFSSPVWIFGGMLHMLSITDSFRIIVFSVIR
jgi:hypothetical protein